MNILLDDFRPSALAYLPISLYAYCLALGTWLWRCL